MSDTVNKARLVYTDILWCKYYKTTNRGEEEAMLEIAEQAAALKELLQEKGQHSKSKIIASIFPGVWALGHLYTECLSAWNKTEDKNEVIQFLSDIDTILAESINSADVIAKLLLLESMLYMALGATDESIECDKKYETLCQKDREIAGSLAKILKIEGDKLTVPIANYGNIASLYGKIERLIGLNAPLAEDIVKKEIESLAKFNSYRDRLESVRKRLMTF